MTDSPLPRLNAYRLSQDLTFEQLSAQMDAAGFFVPARALHLALRGRLKTQPRERTLYKIAEFLKTLDEQAAAPRRRANGSQARKPAKRNGRGAAIHG